MVVAIETSGSVNVNTVALNQKEDSVVHLEELYQANKID